MNLSSETMFKVISEQKSAEKMNHSDSFRKNNNHPLNPLKSLQGILGFVLITAFFIIFLFYFDFEAVTRGIRDRGISTPSNFISPSTLSVETESSAAAELDSYRQPGFLEKGGEGCNIFDGGWVWDDSYPLYQSRDCLFLDGGVRCSENGRPDNFYTKWRWQPKSCDLPRFDARNMLEKLRNRRVVYVGDSIGRNQWESLLCMLASAVSNKSLIYEVNGRPITKHSGILAFMFRDYNCTIEYYRAPYLVRQSRPPPNAPKKVKMTVKVDRLVWTSRLWSDADVLIFNAGHWWTSGKTIQWGCYFEEKGEVKMNMSVKTAFQKSIETLADWIGSQVNTSKTQVFFRTYAPVHFRNGDWNSGGSCHLEKLPDLVPLPTSHEIHYQVAVDVLSKHWNDSQVLKLNLLDVTDMTSRRKDGHIGIYKTIPSPLHRQDCSHWCLPGVPDSWNELLYALFLRRETVHLQY